ncbi:MAG: choloylglycine hydrolase [Eubacteriales bacterium]
MCTAATYHTKCHYFGRTLDYEYSYVETVTVTPRRYPFRFRLAGTLEKHYALIGMAMVSGDYPLYYDATNEKGLSMAGLNFPGNAVYHSAADERDNVTPFEFIPWILGQCATVAEARVLLARLNLVNLAFSEQFPLSPLHWILADADEAVTVESTADGLHVYDNPVGVLTNNPPFPVQLFTLNNYMALSKEPPVNHFSDRLSLDTYSRGMGALGLPGDLSSNSRFVRVAFTKLNSVSGESETESVNQFFHILGSVAQQRGCVKLGDAYEITIYTSCCNTDLGIYYYTTYENSRITAVDMHRENLDADALVAYPLITEPQILMQNA